MNCARSWQLSEKRWSSSKRRQEASRPNAIAAKSPDSGAERSKEDPGASPLNGAARAILRDDAEAEDVMQDAYISAYQHLADFEGRAKFSTWLTRIAVHEAYARTRRKSRFQPLDNPEQSSMRGITAHAPSGRSPEETAYDRELGSVLEKAILRLPEDYRLVVILRDVEEMSTEETAECLNLSQENVKVRLHRARAGFRNGFMRELAQPPFSPSISTRRAVTGS